MSATLPRPASSYDVNDQAQTRRAIEQALDTKASLASVNKLVSYVKTDLPSASTMLGAMIFVSNEVGGAVPAFSDGTNWRRVTDRAVVA